MTAEVMMARWRGISSRWGNIGMASRSSTVRLEERSRKEFTMFKRLCRAMAITGLDG